MSMWPGQDVCFEFVQLRVLVGQPARLPLGCRVEWALSVRGLAGTVRPWVVAAVRMRREPGY